MGEQTHEQTVASMIEPSSKIYAELGPTLKGAGAEAWTAYENLSKSTSALPGMGRSAAAEIARIRSDDSLPGDHRQRVTTEARDTATVLIDKIHQGATAAAKNLEQALTGALRPMPSRDSSERILRRQELDNMLASARGSDLPIRALKLLGRNPGWDAELLGDHGRALFEREDQGTSWDTFQSGATGLLMQAQGGTEKQQAARKALQAFRSGNVASRVSAFAAAARMELARGK